MAKPHINFIQQNNTVVELLAQGLDNKTAELPAYLAYIKKSKNVYTSWNWTSSIAAVVTVKYSKSNP